MFLLILYLFVAIVFSFLCSIAEAVLLSISRVHIAVMEQQGMKSGPILRELKEDVNRPLTAILTLNTVAHTVGAAGVGAQASAVFGSAYLGVTSAILTLLILVFSEIIPKTLGASYYKALAPATAYCLKYLVWALHPFVVMSEYITRYLVSEKESSGFARSEIALMAKLSAEEGHIDEEEATILQNLSLFNQIKIMAVITPRTVVRSIEKQTTVEEFIEKNKKLHFSRIPLYDGESDNVIGYFKRIDALLAHAKGEGDKPLIDFIRPMPTLLDEMSLSHGMKELVSNNDHMALVVNEYGTMRGILTLEDILETLIGQEIVDEDDRHIDMQQLADRLWKARAKKYGIDAESAGSDENDTDSKDKS